MNMEPNISARSPEIEPKENILLGVLGAILFSLAGVIVYFLLDQLNFIASISAVVGAYAAVFGYGLFTKRKNSKAGIIVASVVTVIMMVLAVYLCTAYDLYSQVRADGGTITLSTAAGDCLKTIFGSKDRLTCTACITMSSTSVAFSRICSCRCCSPGSESGALFRLKFRKRRPRPPQRSSPPTVFPAAAFPPTAHLPATTKQNKV